MKNRHIGGHDLNSRSNRSHCMVDVYIELQPGTRASEGWVGGAGLPPNQAHDGARDEGRAVGRITLVDLAGSERLKDTNRYPRRIDSPNPDCLILTRSGFAARARCCRRRGLSTAPCTCWAR